MLYGASSTAQCLLQTVLQSSPHQISPPRNQQHYSVNNYFTMPPADTLLGRCTRRHQGLCTFRGNFHLFLANLGKTNILTDPQQQALIPPEYRKMIKPVPLKGRIFLWDISQLKQDKAHGDASTSTESHQQHQHSNAQFREDLRQFLRLEGPLPVLPNPRFFPQQFIINFLNSLL